MANNYTQSSSMLVLPVELHAKAAIILQREIARIEKAAEEDDEPELCGVFEMDPQGVWFHHDESIDMEQAVTIAQALLDELPVNGAFILSWAHTCSKPRIGEFGGGSCVVRRGHAPMWFDAKSLAEFNAMRQGP